MHVLYELFMFVKIAMIFTHLHSFFNNSLVIIPAYFFKKTSFNVGNANR